MGLTDLCAQMMMSTMCSSVLHHPSKHISLWICSTGIFKFPNTCPELLLLCLLMLALYPVLYYRYATGMIVLYLFVARRLY